MSAVPAPRVLNAREVGRHVEGAVYVGRPSLFGNPFRIGPDAARDVVIAKYRAWLMAQPVLLARVKSELRGKDLVCWCSPEACHADVLIDVANQALA